MATPRTPTVGTTPAAELQRLWQGGERALAIRAVLDDWERILADEQALLWVLPALRACGLEIEAFAAQVALARRRRGDANEWEALLQAVLRSGDPWWAKTLLDEAQATSRALDAARIEVALAIGEEADVDAWLSRHRDAAAVEQAVGWLVRAGRAAQADAVLREAERDGLAGDGLTLWRARLAVWRGDSAAARELLARLPASPSARCLAAIGDVLDGALERAEAQLRALVDGECAADAWGWLATVLRKRGRYEEAVRAADAAAFAAPEFNLVARLERELAVEYQNAGGRGAGRRRPPRFLRWLSGARMRPIRKLENARDLYALGLRPGDSMPELEALLERFAGNHTPDLTTVHDGALRSCRLPVDPRHLGASVQRVLWTRGPRAARALYRELAPRVQGHALYRIYEGEVELWLGEYESAAAVFEEALGRDRRARWAWIGLGASAMLRGRFDEAQRVWRKGIAVSGEPGPTLFVYRGECFRRQGEVEKAREDLQTALRQKPQRLSARINLALLDGDAAALARLEEQCAALAPFLMQELHGGPAERLEQVLAAMRGNRSSTRVSYHLWDRLWSFTTI